MTGYVPDGLPAGAPSQATILTKPFKAVDALAAILNDLGAARDAVHQSSRT